MKMVDQKKVQEAIKLLLEGIGEDTDREGLKETPERIGRMYEEICGVWIRMRENICRRSSP